MEAALSRRMLHIRKVSRLLLSLSALILPSDAISAPPKSIEAQFEQLRKSPPELYAFLLRMPKGGDLHNHLAGAAYAETFLREAAEGSFCIDRKTLAFLPSGSPCPEGSIDSAAAEHSSEISSDVIDTLSMRNFVPGHQSAHDHFFETFEKFNIISHGNDPDYLAEVARRAADQNESYLELMALSAGSAVSALGKQVGLAGDFEVTRQKLLAAGLEQAVAGIRARLDAMEKGRIEKLGCDSQAGSPACQVAIKYSFQVLRLFPKEQVFAQVLAGFMLASSDPRVVAVNFVQPEDGFTSMQDYHLHMQMVAYAKRVFPRVHVSLHAGELASGLVPPEGLRSHIREAILVGGAERIGHGVTIMYETDSLDTLRLMRERRIAVEINLTSNDVILGVRGADHPFPVYRKYGVPVVICTDDEGVSRTHMTQEYQRAVLTYNLTYTDLKHIVRNSLQYSFLPGESFWRDGNYRAVVPSCASGRQTAACERFLAGSEKASLQAGLETRFDAFERQVSQWPLAAK